LGFKMKKIILASASPRRCEILRQMGVSFETIVSNVDEQTDASILMELQVISLALQKAQDVANKISENAIVIGADTLVSINGVILGKPRDTDEAFAFLKLLSGKWHYVYTGIALIDKETGIIKTDYEKTKVKIANITDKHILNYIDSGEPMDKAGAYAIQGKGALLVERIEGCYFNVVGLPVVKLNALLQDFGLSLL
jgi:septum formation protein